jgi:hypothetical protein
MGLDGALVGPLADELIGANMMSRSQCLFHITEVLMDFDIDISRILLVNQRGAFCQRFNRVQDSRQDLYPP